MLISGEDARRDAVYLHTPNPNVGSVFPIRVNGVEWGTSSLDSAFRELLPALDLRTGCSRASDVDTDADTDADVGPPAWRTAHVVWMPGLGVPITDEPRGEKW